MYSQIWFVCVRASAGERLIQVHQQDLPPAHLPPDATLQVDQTERAQEEVPGLVSLCSLSCRLGLKRPRQART